MPHSQNKKLDWFPRMRAMSLCSDEAENDQNEFRDLKVTLESTKSHVESLSKQLQELKDQVLLLSLQFLQFLKCSIVVINKPFYI